jgi:DNA-binding MarR family transcriptional regulator
MPSPDPLDADVHRFDELLAALGKRQSLRDPLAMAVEEMSLTGPQLHAVLWLRREGQLTMGRLSQRVGVTEKTGTGLVDRLERDGYVRRVRDEADRRVVHVRLTDQGGAVAAELDRQITEKMRLMLGLLDPEDRSALFRVLEKLLARTAPAPEAA